VNEALSFEPWQWAMLAVGASFVGLSKSGIPGVGIVIVGVFSNLMPPKLATGVVLPLLIVGDVFAVSAYRKHTRWGHVFRLFPWTIPGVVAGYFALKWIDNRGASLLIGGILLFMMGMHFWRKRQDAAKLEHEVAEHAVWFAPMAGFLAGFTTQVANAAGPVMIIYLLAMRLPKWEFLGTGAAYFFALNLFKVPFMVNLGLITTDTLRMNLWLAPAVVAGSLVGRFVAKRVSQKLFEGLAVVFTVAAAVKLLLG